METSTPKPIELTSLRLKDLTPDQRRIYWQWQWTKHGEKEKARRRSNLNCKANRRAYMRRYKANRKEIDPQFELLESLRSKLSQAISHKSYVSIAQLVGCSIENLRKHIESQFTDGMCWHNYGVKGWCIDHIKPVASYNLLELQQLQECFHYTNLRPLWVKDNLKHTRCVR